MGYTEYSLHSRAIRASASGYHTKSANEIFIQHKEQKIHDLMNPMNLTVRECRDSEAHPNTVPITMALDVTGSMGHIPHDLVKDGLPKLMSNLIQRGVKDASLCFIAIGDHECDRAPLQVGQFESGDEELDMWLTRTWLEGKGGGNAGESYLLAWLFAARHTVTDAFEKRGEKGFLITIGDEPCLKTLPASALKDITGQISQATLTAEELLKAAQEKWHVYHIDVAHHGHAGVPEWKQRLGQNCITVTDYTTIPNVVSQLVADNCKCLSPVPVNGQATKVEDINEEELL